MLNFIKPKRNPYIENLINAINYLKLEVPQMEWRMATVDQLGKITIASLIKEKNC